MDACRRLYETITGYRIRRAIKMSNVSEAELKSWIDGLQ